MIFSLFLAFTSEPKTKKNYQPSIRSEISREKESKKKMSKKSNEKLMRMWKRHRKWHTNECVLIEDVINGAVILRVTQFISSWFLPRYGAIVTVDLSSFRIFRWRFSLIHLLLLSFVWDFRLCMSTVYKNVCCSV